MRSPSSADCASPAASLALASASSASRSRSSCACARVCSPRAIASSRYVRASSRHASTSRASDAAAATAGAPAARSRPTSASASASAVLARSSSLLNASLDSKSSNAFVAALVAVLTACCSHALALAVVADAAPSMEEMPPPACVSISPSTSASLLRRKSIKLRGLGQPPRTFACSTGGAARGRWTATEPAAAPQEPASHRHTDKGTSFSTSGTPSTSHRSSYAFFYRRTGALALAIGGLIARASSCRLAIVRRIRTDGRLTLLCEATGDGDGWEAAAASECGVQAGPALEQPDHLQGRRPARHQPARTPAGAVMRLNDAKVDEEV
eukprot:scaffold7714_cov133-Isochrysis_galbana.AAC.8